MGRVRIDIRGIVQGVGFRPFVYGLARRHGLRGYVKNTSDGVVIEIEGDGTDRFVHALRSEPPPLARILGFQLTPLPSAGFADFTIIQSADEGSFTHVSPDVAVCGDCLRELTDPSDRRYLYPFINCTNCGPRYTITRSVPYDRPNTTMAAFAMCPACLEEYHDPADRRFHAQPNACPVCGPQVELRMAGGRDAEARAGDALGRAIALLKDGAILAARGLGGFHLCCDASNADAVRRLRTLKQRVNKPFALMAAGLDQVRQFCKVTNRDEEVLSDRRRPIVLLRRHEDGLPDEVAPGNSHLGFMLPYTPLHHLLFIHPATPGGSSTSPDEAPPGFPGFPDHRSAHFRALVMTSGNLSEEPIVTGNDEALSVLCGIADAFLLHNRDIFMRVDDSVVRPVAVCAGPFGPAHTARGGPDQDGEVQGPGLSFVRRARGYVPEPIPLADEGPDVLGCGADIKNTFTIMKGPYAIVSQHIGDMENIETLRFFEESLGNLRQVYRADPVAVGHDLHPGYASTRWALELAREAGLRSLAVQHHHAHIAAVMAEHGCTGPVIGVAFDGTGYGTDGTLWGGEFLLCLDSGFERVGHLKCVPLPGGEAAIRHPWRSAVSYIKDSAGDSDPVRVLERIGFMDTYGPDAVRAVLDLVPRRQFSPLSSGAGRLFDAVSAIAGVCGRNTFEGEAAVALESRIAPDGSFSEGEIYRFRLSETVPFVIDLSEAIMQIAGEVARDVDPGVVSQRFHNTIVTVIGETVRRIGTARGVRNVALSGGVFQNAYVLEGTVCYMHRLGFTPLTHRTVPCNDACISLGQACLVRRVLGDL